MADSSSGRAAKLVRRVIVPVGPLTPVASTPAGAHLSRHTIQPWGCEEMTMDATRLAEIEARASAATPGPWRPGTYETDRVFAWRHDGQSEWVVMAANSNFDLRSDVAFAAHARQDVPDLVDAVRRLTAERDEALEQVGKVLECVTIERRARDAAEAELTAAREALGVAWLAGGRSLAEGIRRKTAALERLVQTEAERMRVACRDAARDEAAGADGAPAPGLLVCAGAGACGSVRCPHHGPHETRPGCISVCHYDEECRPVCCVPVATTATAPTPLAEGGVTLEVPRG